MQRRLFNAEWEVFSKSSICSFCLLYCLFFCSFSAIRDCRPESSLSYHSVCFFKSSFVSIPSSMASKDFRFFSSIASIFCRILSSSIEVTASPQTVCISERISLRSCFRFWHMRLAQYFMQVSNALSLMELLLQPISFPSASVFNMP